MSEMYVASFSTACWLEASTFRKMHTAEVAELRVARAVAQVSAQILCPQCSRLHCLAQAAQLNLLKYLLAGDLGRSLQTVNGL